jgi:hypothetical protein
MQRKVRPRQEASEVVGTEMGAAAKRIRPEQRGDLGLKMGQL